MGQYKITHNRPINVRAHPDKGRILTIAQPGDVVEKLDERDEYIAGKLVKGSAWGYDWGWMWGGFLTPVDSIEPPSIPPPDPPLEDWVTHWPTNNKTITQHFGSRPDVYSQYNLPGHEGLDIRAFHGTPIYAIGAGVVDRTGDDRLPRRDGGHNYGVRVYIDHQNGYTSVYAHLDRRMVSVGDEVAGGQQIGMADSTGNSNASHLHLTLKKEGATDSGETDYPYDIINPFPYLRHLVGGGGN